MIKKGDKVKILRKDSYWYNKIGIVVNTEKSDLIKYPVTIRFSSVNYNEVNTNNFSLTEIEKTSN